MFVSSVSKLLLLFPPSLPLFSSRTQISYSSIHFIHVKSLHSFPSMFLSGDFHEDSNGASSSSFFVLFLLRWIQFKLLVLIISFPRFKRLLILVHLLIIHFSLFNCSGVLKISRRFVFPFSIRSSYFEVVISFKPVNSTGAIPTF